jgi:hypothetical protein
VLSPEKILSLRALQQIQPLKTYSHITTKNKFFAESRGICGILPRQVWQLPPGLALETSSSTTHTFKDYKYFEISPAHNSPHMAYADRRIPAGP